jgi:isoleucyl-tRNA synthetase
MDFANEAGEIRAFKRVIERGFVYRGLKPVYWCFDCGSSLAEFEIEYADKKSHAIDVAFECAEPARLAQAFALEGLPKPAFAVIWTTTPWTIPANQALNLNPELEYSLVDTERGLLVLASALVEKCLARYGLAGTVLARRWGALWTASASAIRWPAPTRATTASRPCTWPSTPRPRTARASCTRRRPTASTTSTRARRTA